MSQGVTRGATSYAAVDRTVELRVHGVSGTPPEELLDRPLVVQVGGDATAGFYRPRLAVEERDDRPGVVAEGTGERLPAGPGPRLEAYCWGGLTSGAPSRALWLYLLPFTLVNVAARARADHGRPGLVRLHWWGARLLALALTGLYVVTTIGIGAAVTAHPQRLPGPLADAGPGPLLVLGATVPLVHVLVLWLVSRRTSDHYELVRAQVVTADGDAVPPAPRTAGYERHLDTHDMWFNAAEVTRLRAVHVQTGLALVAVVLLWGSPWLAVPAVVVAPAVVRALLPVLAEPGPWARLMRLPWALVAAALVGGAVRGLRAGPEELEAVWGASRDGAFRWLTVAVLGAGLAGLALVWGAAVVARVTGGRGGAGDEAGEASMAPQAPACAGLAAPVAATLATFVGGAFAGGLYLYGASYVATGSWTASVTSLQQVARSSAVPPSVEVGAVAFLLGLVLLGVLLLVAGAALLWVWSGRWPARRVRGAAAAVADDYPAGDGQALDPARVRQVQRAVLVGGFVDHAPTVLGTLAAGGLLVTLVSAALVARDPALPGGVSVSALQAWGGWLAVRTLVLLIGLGALAFRVPATRRKVGILWDVASFWPRTAHPLAAPCYAERTVPDLATRVSWLLSKQVEQEQGQLVGGGPQVVLAGHSQGSVIAAATVLHLHTVLDAEQQPDRLEGLSLLTFGCVVRRLYGRWFPVYLGPRALDRVADALGDRPCDGERVRWVNLWRYTDYLGGQVSDGPPCALPEPALAGAPGVRVGPRPFEWHAPDPTFARPPGMTTYAAPRGHSGFTTDPSGVFQDAVLALTLGDYPRRASASASASSRSRWTAPPDITPEAIDATTIAVGSARLPVANTPGTDVRPPGSVGT